MRIVHLILCTLMVIGTSAYAGDEQTSAEADIFCSGCSALERAAFMNAKDEWLAMVSLAANTRCDSSADCPGSTSCRNGRCQRSNGDGIECDSSSDCPASASCRHGRCVRSNGNGVECDSSSDCRGSETCRRGRCTRH